MDHIQQVNAILEPVRGKLHAHKRFNVDHMKRACGIDVVYVGRRCNILGQHLFTRKDNMNGVASLGAEGIASYWQALKLVEADTGHAYFTIALVFGLGSVTYVLLAIQGLACLAVARIRRHDLETVFAVGLLGSLMVAFHLHQWDYTNLVLAAWLVLRNSPPLWHRIWLAAGILTMQLLSLGVAVPQLVWDVVWLAILAAGAFDRGRVTIPAGGPTPSPLRTPQGQVSR